MKQVIFVLLIIFHFNLLKAQLISNPQRINDMEVMFKVQKEIAKNRSSELYDVFYKSLGADERQALIFMYAYMPLSDLADYNGDFFRDNVQISLKAREEMPWGKNIPEEVFLHFVLPLRVNNENLDSFRIVKYDELKSRVKGMSMKDAALEVNHWCHEKVAYQPSDDRTSSPLSTIKYSLGRCGEESTFAVTALRTVGIPARQVYTPRWAHTDDNHAWVEVWVDGKWYFLGACEPEPDLNMGWFAVPATRAMLVHTRAYGKYFGKEQVITKEDRYSELNLIQNYAKTKTFFVKVIDSSGKNIDSGKVEFQLYNYSEFFPIAKKNTDKNGIASLTCGLGDLLIWANKGDAYGFQKITVATTDTVKIKIFNKHTFPESLSFENCPPIPHSVASGSEEGRIINDKRLLYEDSLRHSYMSTFKDSVWGFNFAKLNNLNTDSTSKIVCKSFGNWAEITSFLKNIDQNNKNQALKLLYNISDKDLRDTKEKILNDHLNISIKNNKLKIKDNDFWTKYVMSGRIANENMIDWRGYLDSKFEVSFKNNAFTNPAIIINWINENIKVNNIANAHSRAPLSPKGVYDLKYADYRSRDIFFVGLCRTLDIPARINPELQVPQFWNGKDWQTVSFEKTNNSATAQALKGFLHLTNPNKDIEPKYYSNFTIEGFNNGVYRSLEYEENKKLKDFPEKIELPSGNYLLVTGDRLQNGNVLCYMHFFKVDENKTTTLPVIINQQKDSEIKPWAAINIDDYSFTDYISKQILPFKTLSKDKSSLIIFIEPDKEPTKHVINDLASIKDRLEKWNGNIIIGLSNDKITKAFNPSNYKALLPSKTIFAYDYNNKLINDIAKIKNKPLSNSYPIILITDKNGNLMYYSEGYTIGIGEQLIKYLK